MTKRLSIKQKLQLENYKKAKKMGHYAEQYEKSNLDFEEPEDISDLKSNLKEQHLVKTLKETRLKYIQVV